MQLHTLLEGIDYDVLQGDVASEVTHIAYDSRKVERGGLFACLPGLQVDGHAYAAQAVRNGARVLLVERSLSELQEGIKAGLDDEVTVVRVAKTRRTLPLIADRFYGHPSGQLNLVGITGTNGKTTVASLVSHILERAGRTVGTIGTIDFRIGNRLVAVDRTTPTTPEAVDLQYMLRQMVDEGADAAVIEATSMGLEMHRVDGCSFAVGVFTNLTPDHLDDHGTMDAYKQAKLKLFDKCDRAVINADDPVAKDIQELDVCPTITYAIEQEADYRAADVDIHAEGVRFTLHIDPDQGGQDGGETWPMSLAIPGTFSVYNALAAIGVCHTLGLDMEAIQHGLQTVQGVKGRFQTIKSTAGYAVIVDYAHTADALENVLQTVTEFTTGRVITVFGCGGDRDRTKRPEMGRIAAQYSHRCVITSDNPRTEDPQRILADIEQGMNGSESRYTKIEDREKAIEYALEEAESGDVVVIAGKGHETYQVIGEQTFDFDDVHVVEQYLDRHGLLAKEIE